MSTSVLFQVFVFLVAACCFVPLAHRFRLGAVLGYLAAGILIGPSGLGIIHDPASVMHFAEFGVVMMLFLIGLELEPAMLWRMRVMLVGLGGLQVTATTALFFGVGLLLGVSWPIALAVAMALSLSSTALVLQALRERNLHNTSLGHASLAVLLFQDIAVIPILIVLPLLAPAVVAVGQGSFLETMPGFVRALAILGAVMFLILIGRYFSHVLFRAVARARMREVFTALSLALVVGTTLLMHLVGVSPALGAFVAGVVLANSEYRRTVETDVEPFKGLLLGLFFISVGMGMALPLLITEWPRVLLLLSLLMLGKVLVIYVVASLFRVDANTRLGLALALCQGGEFAFVLFQYAGQLNLLSLSDAGLLTLVVALSMALTPLILMAYEHLFLPRMMSTLPQRAYDHVDSQHPIILAGFGRFGQVIGRFLMAQGVQVTVLEKDPEQIDLIRKFGFKAYYGDATRLDILRGAGAADARLMIVAVGNRDACLHIVDMVKAEFPQLVVFARARNREHAYLLHKAGADAFKRETFDGALNFAQEILIRLGYSEASVRRKAKVFRQHDEDTMRASFEFFEDEAQLISFAKSSRAELQRILQSDEDTERPA